MGTYIATRTRIKHIFGLDLMALQVVVTIGIGTYTAI
jgi:hypothetical protein